LCIGDNIQYTLFAPTEECHQALQKLGINKRGQEFSITKTTQWNKDTGKTVYDYEVELGIVTEPPPEARKKSAIPEDPLGDTPYIEDSRAQIGPYQHTKTFEECYGRIMEIKLAYFGLKVKWSELDRVEQINILCELDKSTSANVSTILIQNGDRR
jgi:hypothetical protein